MTNINFAVFDVAGARDLDALRSDFAKLREDVHADIAKLREDVRADIAKLRDEMGALRREFDERLNGLAQRVTRLEERAANMNRLLWGVLIVVVLSLLKGWMIP